MRRKQCHKFLILLLPLILEAAAPCLADTEKKEEALVSEPQGRTRYEPVKPRSHEFIESFQYVSYIYAATVPLYLAMNNKEVFSNASFNLYFSNFGNMTFFDQDLPTANWILHVVTGSLAFEFYRSRSYDLTDAFILTLIQECLFQFTLETLIQPTALENVANTTILGTILGRGLELSSLPLLNSGTLIFRGLGYVLNPSAAFGFWENQVKLVPMVGTKTAGLSLKVNF